MAASNGGSTLSPRDFGTPGIDKKASHYASQRSLASSVGTPSSKQSKRLPPHVETVLHGRKKADLRTRHLIGQGLYSTEALLPGLNRELKTLPWERSVPDDAESAITEGSTRGKSTYSRQRKPTPHTSQAEPNKYLKLGEILDEDPHGKIKFTNTNETMEVTPNWVTHRLQDSCRAARFGLPSDMRKLEGMTPMEYLEKHTHLSRTHRRRYDLVFKKFAEKNDKLKFENLYPALNSIFANSLGKENFDILCTILFLPQEPIQSKDLFAGICAITERWFWSSYMDHGNDNTFFQVGPNRSVLECADFNGLLWKLRGLKISIELNALLFSLA